MFSIDADTAPASLKKYFEAETDREELRTSQERRERLEKLASMHAGKDVYVQISGTQAYADIAERDSKLGYTDRVVINVPAEVPNQAVTNYDGEQWDRLFQKTEMYHELGHVLYTDWPSFEDVLFGDGQQYGVDTQLRAPFRDWWNCLEDAAIEKLLAGRFNIADDLRVKNENLLRQNHPSQTGKVKSLHEAVTMALMEHKHPVGWIDTLLDEANDDLQFLTDDDRKIFEDEMKPVIDDIAPQVVDEGDPVERNRLVYEMYEQLKPRLDFGDAPGTDDRMTFGFPDDGEDRGDESGGQSVEMDEDGDEVAVPEGDEVKGIDHDVQREHSDDLKQEKDAVSNQQGREASIEKWGRVMNGEYDTDSDLSIQIPDDPPDKGSYDDATRHEAERLSQPLSRELQQRLKYEQRSKKKSGQKTGKVDSTAVHKTGKGKTNVFKQTVDPDDKDYSCFIIVDRSGSMDYAGTDMMPDTEASAGALAYGLEEVGVDVGQLSLTRGSIQLEKAMTEDVEEAKKRMFRGYNGGGTPLSDALQLAKGRLEDKGGHPFVIVLTDGEPDHRERYRDILHSCSFPVLGIYINRSGDFDEDQMNESAYFHALEYRKYDEALDGARNLVKQVMF